MVLQLPESSSVGSKKKFEPIAKNPFQGGEPPVSLKNVDCCVVSVILGKLGDYEFLCAKYS
jgi:hypothetical protein